MIIILALVSGFIVMQAFLFLMTYYAGKLVLKLFLGSRVPAREQDRKYQELANEKIT